MRMYRWEKWLLIIPTLFVVLLVFIFPLFYSVGMSVTSRNLLRPQLGTKFVGLENFIELTRDEEFAVAIKNTLYFTFGGIPVQLILGLSFALLLNRRIPGINAFRMVIVIPMIIAPLINSFAWLMIFQPSLSPITAILDLFRLDVEMPILLASTKTVMPALITVSTYMATPFVALVLLAGLQSLPQEPFEAAKIDGASRWQTLLLLTIPMLKPAILVIIMIRVMDAMRSFDLFFVMTSGGPANASMVLSLFNYEAMYHRLTQGYASAISVMTFAIIIVLCIVLHRMTLRSDEG